jgi:hypothetical protein
MSTTSSAILCFSQLNIFTTNIAVEVVRSLLREKDNREGLLYLEETLEHLGESRDPRCDCFALYMDLRSGIYSICLKNLLKLSNRFIFNILIINVIFCQFSHSCNSCALNLSNILKLFPLSIYFLEELRPLTVF